MRTIHLIVAGDTVQTDSTVAGVQGSGNVDKLVARFDASWDGYAKSAAWWDAHGVQAGEPRLLTAELLEDGLRDLRSYILVVPPEALRCAGTCTLVIDGWSDAGSAEREVGALGRTVRQEFQVVAAPEAAMATSVTPSQAQQLQHEIEMLLGGVAGSGAKAAQEAYIAKCWAQGEPEQETQYVQTKPETAVAVAAAPVDGAAYRFRWNGEDGEETAQAVCVDGYVSAGWLEWYTDETAGPVVRNSSGKDLGCVTIEHVPYFQADAPEEDRTGAWEWAKRAMTAQNEAQAARDKAGECADDAGVYRDEAVVARDEAVVARDEAVAARDEAAKITQSLGQVNLLDNWYFLDPINQRGQTEYTGRGYTVDRWRTWENYPVVLTSKGLTISANLYQYIDTDNLESFVGKEFTLSILFADGHLYSKALSVLDTSSVYSVEVNYGGIASLDFYVPRSPKIWTVRIPVPTSGVASSEILAVKLELGAQQTLAHQDADGNWVLNDPPPNRALELAKCQRHYMEFNGTDEDGGAVLLGYVSPADVTRVSLKIPTPVTMRAAPAVTVSGDFAVGGTDAGLSYSGGGSLDLNGIEVYNVTSDRSISSSGVVNVSMLSGSKIILDANL